MPKRSLCRCNELLDSSDILWWQYRASVWLKPYPAKQRSSAHNHHQSCHCVTFAKSSISCLLYLLCHPYALYYALLIRRIFICLYTGVSSLLCSVLAKVASSLAKRLMTAESMTWLTPSRSYARSALHATWYVASIRTSKTWYVMSYNPVEPLVR